MVTLLPNNFLNSSAPFASSLLPIDENNWPHPSLIVVRLSKILSMSSVFAPSFFNLALKASDAFLFILPKLIDSMPSLLVVYIGLNLFAFFSLDNKTWFISLRSSFLLASTVLSPIALLKNGNSLLIALSRFLTAVSDAFKSPASKPILFLPAKNCSWVSLPLARKGLDIHFSIHLFNAPSVALPALVASLNFFIPKPTPPNTPVNNAPSVPNLILFNISLPGS